MIWPIIVLTDAAAKESVLWDTASVIQVLGAMTAARVSEIIIICFQDASKSNIHALITNSSI